MYFNDLRRYLQKTELKSQIGKIENVVGLTIEASGIKAGIGDLCYIGPNQMMAEVVGFRNDRTLLMPFAEIDGIAVGNFVRNTGRKKEIIAGDFLRGHIINALGMPIAADDIWDASSGTICSEKGYINPLCRPPIRERLNFGVKAIDGMLTIGKGQRIGIFAGSGVGKSTLMGMIARNSSADINVIALVGERGREVLEFIEKDLGETGLARSVVVVATSDESAMLRKTCPLTATSIAEYFKDQGYNVLLMMDSLTRFAMAQREIGLATGEPPIARGYTPSIYSELPKLLERSGNFENGSITGIYTVLVEGDDTNEPIADTVRGIIDGHIVLSRKLAAKNHFPAIDVSASISRLMDLIVPERHMHLASRIRDALSLYEQNEDLIAIGAYKSGTNPRLDDAISRIDRINQFLKQQIAESLTYEETMAQMETIFLG